MLRSPVYCQVTRSFCWDVLYEWQAVWGWGGGCGGGRGRVEARRVSWWRVSRAIIESLWRC